MAFQPLVNYAGYEHVLNAAVCFVHPGNGNAYGAVIEKKGGIQQNLSVYRVRPGSNERELVHRWTGGVDSAAQIAQGGCIIHPDGSLEAWASAVPPNDPNVTKTGFQGVCDRVPGKDDPYVLQSELLARIATLEQTIAHLPVNTTGPIVKIPASSATEGGELQLLYSGGVYFLDVSSGVCRLVKQESGQPGKVLQVWS